MLTFLVGFRYSFPILVGFNPISLALPIRAKLPWNALFQIAVCHTEVSTSYGVWCVVLVHGRTYKNQSDGRSSLRYLNGLLGFLGLHPNGFCLEILLNSLCTVVTRK